MRRRGFDPRRTPHDVLRSPEPSRAEVLKPIIFVARRRVDSRMGMESDICSGAFQAKMGSLAPRTSVLQNPAAPQSDTPAGTWSSTANAGGKKNALECPAPRA